jgi:AcrR family transcriptional regulator
VARRAGVSHAAPAHHFGDKAGLLTAFAVQGFEALADRLRAARRDATSAGRESLGPVGLAYVRFAIEEPGRFAVMFRPDELHASTTPYRAANAAAFDVLLDAVREVRPDLGETVPELVRAASGAWSIVHGFATLWLDGNLDEELATLDPIDAAAATLGAFGATLSVIGGHAPPAVGRSGPHGLDA